MPPHLAIPFAPEPHCILETEQKQEDTLTGGSSSLLGPPCLAAVQTHTHKTGSIYRLRIVEASCLSSSRLCAGGDGSDRDGALLCALPGDTLPLHETRTATRDVIKIEDDQAKMTQAVSTQISGAGDSKLTVRITLLERPGQQCTACPNNLVGNTILIECTTCALRLQMAAASTQGSGVKVAGRWLSTAGLPAEAGSMQRELCLPPNTVYLFQFQARS